MICLVTIFLKIVNYKSNKKTIFLKFILSISNTSRFDNLVPRAFPIEALGTRLHVSNDRPLHFNKRFMRKNITFNLELFKTLILNFAYIHSQTRKLGMFILFQQCHFVYPNKVNSPISFIFNFWSRDKSRFHNKTSRHKKTSRFTFEEKIHFILGLLARDIASHSYGFAKNFAVTQSEL